MSAPADPTTRLLDRFSDKSRWVIEDSVPIFDEHVEHDAQGEIVRQFGLKELREIAENCNRREVETGNVVPLMLGHTRPGLAETEQPPVVGYARRFRVGRFGPQKKLAVLCTMYFHKDLYHEHDIGRQYPHRSVELWPSDGIFDPIALLKRTPKLDLGILSYAQQRGRVIYQMDSEDSIMYEQGQATMPESIAAQTAAVPHPHPHYPAEHAHLHAAHPAIHHVMHYLAHHPVFKHAHHLYMQHHGGSMAHAGAAGPGMASGTSTFVPGMSHHPIHMQREGDAPGIPATSSSAPGGAVGSAAAGMQATEPQRLAQTQQDIEVARYQRQLEEQQALNRQLAERVSAMERESRLARYERDLGHLISQGYEMNLAEELREVADLNIEQFARHKERIQKHYRRMPLGGTFLPLANQAQEGGPGPEKPITQEERDAAISLSFRGSKEDNPHYGNFKSAIQHIREQAKNGQTGTSN